MKIYFASDHAGFELKSVLMAYAQTLGHEVEDSGAFQYDAGDDYPQFIAAAARSLAADAAEGFDSRAIVIGASGQGEAMAANRFEGVRCALYYGDVATMQTDESGQRLDNLLSTRAHNNANALSLGARFITEEQAKRALERWLTAAFSGEERHVRRNAALDVLPNNNG